MPFVASPCFHRTRGSRRRAQHCEVEDHHGLLADSSASARSGRSIVRRLQPMCVFVCVTNATAPSSDTLATDDTEAQLSLTQPLRPPSRTSRPARPTKSSPCAEPRRACAVRMVGAGEPSPTMRHICARICSVVAPTLPPHHTRRRAVPSAPFGGRATERRVRGGPRVSGLVVGAPTPAGSSGGAASGASAAARLSGGAVVDTPASATQSPIHRSCGYAHTPYASSATGAANGATAATAAAAPTAAPTHARYCFSCLRPAGQYALAANATPFLASFNTRVPASPQRPTKSIPLGH